MNILNEEELIQKIKERRNFIIRIVDPITLRENDPLNTLYEISHPKKESDPLNTLYEISHPKKHKRIPYKYGKHSYRKEVK